MVGCRTQQPEPGYIPNAAHTSELYKRASLIIVVTNGFKRILVNHGVDENKIHVIISDETQLFNPLKKNV